MQSVQSRHFYALRADHIDHRQLHCHLDVHGCYCFHVRESVHDHDHDYRYGHDHGHGHGHGHHENGYDHHHEHNV